MALFEINRYREGDDEIVNEESQEKNILSNLREKIEKRKSEKLKREKSIKKQRTLSEVSEDKHDLPETLEKSEEQANVDYIAGNAPNNKRELRDLPINVGQFQILGVHEFQKKTKVKRVLPYWLSHPTAVSVNLNNDAVRVEDIEFLHESLKKKMNKEGIKHLFPVQAQVVPWLLKEYNKGEYFWPRDICVSAPTGSGKTLSFALPIIQILSKRIDRQIRALIVLPVKELAAQVAKVFKDFCIGTNLKVALITGSCSKLQEQAQLLKYTKSAGWQSEVDIMVCTAGRLVEHLQFSKGFNLKHLKFLVIDEADRIMQHIQNDWLYHFNQHIEFGKTFLTGNAPPPNFKTISSLRRPPQKLFFSATLSQDPEKLKEWGLFQPKLFSVVTSKSSSNNNNEETLEKSIGKYSTPLELTEKFVVCDIEQKPAVLYTLLKKDTPQVLCFTNSSQSAHRLSLLLRHMVDGQWTVAELSSALSRTGRDTVLKKFQTGAINILISTDALARGIDITNCDSVISYDPPKNVKTYIHRIGRTGRAGRQGVAVAILMQNQLKSFHGILKTAEKSDIEEIIVDHNVLNDTLIMYESAMAKFKLQVSNQSSKKIIKLKAIKRGRTKKNQRKNSEEKKEKPTT